VDELFPTVFLPPLLYYIFDYAVYDDSGFMLDRSVVPLGALFVLVVELIDCFLLWPHAIIIPELLLCVVD
jgi:hypothetical protein